MTIALWCVLAAGLIPYVFTIAAKSAPGFSNRTPRVYLEEVEGWRRRAHWAQMNGFEAFPLFAAGVLTAEFANAAQAHVDTLALVFVAARIAYGLAYVADRATIRSLVWFVALLAAVGQFVVAA